MHRSINLRLQVTVSLDSSTLGPNIIEDTPAIGGVGQTTQYETCIEPTAAVAIDTAADQKDTEHMAQPGPGPDPDPGPARTASEVSSAADGDSTTEDLPTSTMQPPCHVAWTEPP